MRVLLLIILLLIAARIYSQRKVYDCGFIRTSGWYFGDSTYCYFRAIEGEKMITLKIKAFRDSILSPIFIVGYDSRYTPMHVPKVGKRGFSEVNLHMYNREVWSLLESGIYKIVFIGKKMKYRIKINDNFKNLKNYAE
jgi:hypothetical protein